jgi:uncharacterized protein (TIGR03000 family)
MGSRSLLAERATLTAVLFLAGSSAWGQIPFPQPADPSPRAASAAGDPGSPISPFMFGAPAYPFRGTAPVSYRGATLPDQQGGAGGLYRGPSLGSAPIPTFVSLTQPQQAPPRIGSFVGFAPLASLSLADTALTLPGSGYRPPPDNTAHITLRVPADAEVFFDGKKTKLTGIIRRYNTPPLTPGKKSSYEVLVRWSRDGKQFEQKRNIEVEARDWLRFDLTQP